LEVYLAKSGDTQNMEVENPKSTLSYFRQIVVNFGEFCGFFSFSNKFYIKKTGNLKQNNRLKFVCPKNGE
jgi:hypothetical protein